MNSKIKLLEDGLKKIKNIKTNDRFEKIDKKMTILAITDAINICKGILPDYVIEIQNEGKATQEEINIHLKKLVEEGLDAINKNSFKSL